jgi:FlaA1/EpsC-like NDP-sugar epimerase
MRSRQIKKNTERGEGIMKKILTEFFRNKVILVSGGTGSIGSEMVRSLLEYPVKQVRIFSRDEHKQYQLKQEFKDLPLGKVTFLIGDVRDRERVFLATEGVNMIFNAAAMKHVPLCESNPFEAIKTNVVGAQNLVDAARAHNIEKFVHISTDKAAMPVNVMGATKLLSEKIAISAEHYKGEHKTVFCAVRFGNVLGSRGSAVPLFYEQIKNGGPVTLTHKDMTRFMLKIPQAVELVFKAAYMSNGEELFILKMPILRMVDVVNAMIEIAAPRFGHKPDDIKIKIIGKRDGEKMYELLLTDEEAEDVHENEEMFCITKRPLKGFRPSSLKHYRSDERRPMTYKEVLKLLKGVL